MTVPALRKVLGGWLLLVLGWRVAYVWLQARIEPTFTHPVLDAAYYLDWARRIAAGQVEAEGAYYLAPLYPHALGAFLALFGERTLLLELLQQGLSVVTAGLLGLVAVRASGPLAGLCTAVLCSLYPPLVFFASRPLGETLALALLAGALLSAGRDSWAAQGAGGALAAAAALARPNLVLLPFLWAALELRSPRALARMGPLVAGALLVLLPVALRNAVASGHLVPISSNAGITAFQGNAPGARGVYAPAPGVTGDLLVQREEATLAARQATGEALDAVEADRWWGRQALRARLADPWGSLRLLAWRALLLADNHEHGLDYHPRMDLNALRPSLRWPGTDWRGTGLPREIGIVPFALLLGLATAAVAGGGFSDSGGSRVWSSIGVAALAPLLFYVSSRYRLPAAGLLTVPAGIGLARLIRGSWRATPTRAAAGLGAAAVILSLGVPSGALQRSGMADALSKRAALSKKTGDLAEAVRLGQRAVGLDSRSANVRYNLGVVLEAAGRVEEAESSYRDALVLEPHQAVASTALASSLIRRGAPAEAVLLLRQALSRHPTDRGCWTSLVVAYLASDQAARALEAAGQAAQVGVELAPGLLEEARRRSSSDGR